MIPSTEKGVNMELKDLLELVKQDAMDSGSDFDELITGQGVNWTLHMDEASFNFKVLSLSQFMEQVNHEIDSDMSPVDAFWVVLNEKYKND